MLWMLDTNIVSYAIRNEGEVAANLRRHDRDHLAISVITLSELRYGDYRKASDKLHQAINGFLSGVQIMDFTAAAAERYASVMFELNQIGLSIDDHDGQIAGHAMSVGATLVTHNTKHFQRIKGLKLADWY